MIYLIIIPALLGVVPWLLVRYVFATPASERLSYGDSVPWLFSAGLLWMSSFYLPVIPLSQTDTFSQHAMGGVVAALLFWYAVRAYGWRFAYWWQLPLALFFFVSGLGVLNELFELVLTQSGVFIIDSSDVWWDLLANTTGATVALSVYLWYSRFIKHP